MDKIVVIAASAGGLNPLRRIIAALPIPCAAAVFVVMHIGPHRSVLPCVLSGSGRLTAAFAQDGELIQGGHIYVAPPDHHMILGPSRVKLSQGPKIHYTRPAADPLFISAAKVYGPRVLGIVLSGGDSDGAAGLRTIKEYGGVAFVQDPEEAATPAMPRSAIMAGHPDDCLSTEEIAERIQVFCSPAV